MTRMTRIRSQMVVPSLTLSEFKTLTGLKKSLAFTRLFKVFRKNYFTSKMLLAGFTSASKPLGSMVIFLMADLGLPIVNS